MDLSDALPSRLRPYVRDGRISVMPAKRAARLVLLDQVAQVFRAPRAFEPGRRYPEQAVNEILKAVYDDHAALRRYLIDESLLSRTPDGTYWRSGGTVPIAQDGAESPGGPESERASESQER
jgi:hypothetical protein